MKWGRVVAGSVAAGAGLLLYGALVETEKLELVQRKLRLRNLPERLNGFRIGVLADLHLRDRGTIELSNRAVAALLDQSPDMVAIVGDFVSAWRLNSAEMLGEVLAPLLAMQGNVVAVPGNRDYRDGDPELLRPILDHLDIKLLRNECWHHEGIQWVGIDSQNGEAADPVAALNQVNGDDPIVILWHEPDMVDTLPSGPFLMISGHSHGGQFTTPWGWAPIRSKNGEKYLRGFFPDTSIPLYVSRGLGTTGPPSRLFCRPEVTILELHCAD